MRADARIVDFLFVAKVNVLGTALLYAGYIGGAGDDVGNGIAVDSAGNAYVTGTTNSSEATFPVTVGPDLTFNGGLDAFVAKVNVLGTALLYAGYIGGAGDDVGNGIAVDSAGNAYVTGETNSSEATFPVAGGPDLTFNGVSDAFVAKVNAAGTALDYAGYIGGAARDRGNGIAVDSAGNAYVIGRTASSEATFPVTAGPDLTFNGGIDAFVAKIAEVTLSADLSVTKTDSPDPVVVGQNLTYTITVTNNGPDPATGVILTDDLPDSAAFVSASPQCMYIQANHTVVCSLGTLTSGATATVTIVVRPLQGGTITNTASVSAVEMDPNAANNTATESTTVHGPPNPPEPPACGQLPPQAPKPPICP